MGLGDEERGNLLRLGGLELKAWRKQGGEDRLLFFRLEGDSWMMLPPH